MVSTKDERRQRARLILNVLVGSHLTRLTYGGFKRPPTLPKGMNYSQLEWVVIRDVASDYLNDRDVSLLKIFALEEMEEKYRSELFLAKLHT